MIARLLLLDDQPIFRAGLRAVLSRIKECEVVGEASTPEDALTLAAALRPNVVVLEPAPLGAGGLDAAGRIRGALPDTRLLVVSSRIRGRFVARALAAGVSGYLPRSVTAVELEKALRVIEAGGLYVSPSVEVPLQLHAVSSALPDEVLTPRQLEILRLLASGVSAKRIAVRLGLSRRTVESHRTGLMKRLGLTDMATLVRYAIREGVVVVDD